MNALLGLLLAHWLAVGTETERRLARLIVAGLVMALIALVLLCHGKEAVS